MKKASEYLKNTFDWSYETQELTWYVNKWIDLIKQAQEDAIRETVKECAENFKLDEYKMGIAQGSWRECNSHQNIRINEKSVLSIADKLIKEL